MGIFGYHIWISFVTCEQGFRVTTNTEKYKQIKVPVIVTKMLENILENQRTIQILGLQKKIEPYIQSIS